MANRTYPGTGDNTPAARALRETHWRRLIGRWRESGLAKSVFCGREGVSDASLHWWLAEIARRDGRGPRLARTSTPAKKHGPPGFVPLRIVPARTPELQPFELVVAGQIVRVPPAFDPEALRRLIDALEGHPC
jgi:hypothetical protein